MNVIHRDFFSEAKVVNFIGGKNDIFDIFGSKHTL